MNNRRNAFEIVMGLIGLVLVIASLELQQAHAIPTGLAIVGFLAGVITVVLVFLSKD